MNESALLGVALFASVATAGLSGCVGEFGESSGMETAPMFGDAPHAPAAAGDGGALGTPGNSTKPAVVPSDCPPVTNEAPASLRCTGLYASFDQKLVGSDVDGYTPAYSLWSDAAQKTRFIKLPPGAKIDTSNMDEWTFPVGTKLWKEFIVGGKRIETRFFWKTDAATWVKTTYRWTENETDAVRFEGGALVAVAGATEPYEIPSVDQCESCHSGRIDKVLGFEAVSLGLPAAKGMTLAALAGRDRLTAPPAVTSFVIPDDGTGKAVPALGWMHSNCGITCHSTSPGAACGFRGMNLRLSYGELVTPDGTGPRVEALAAYVTTSGVASSLPDETYQRITPGDPSRSAISYLAGRRDPTDPNGQMPPRATRLIDPQAITAINSWIAAM